MLFVSPLLLPGSANSPKDSGNAGTLEFAPVVGYVPGDVEVSVGFGFVDSVGPVLSVGF